jgi:hypothetical protein
MMVAGGGGPPHGIGVRDALIRAYCILTPKEGALSSVLNVRQKNVI